jgi:CBS domain-containing protein
MAQHEVGALLVMRGDQLVGIVTDRDLAVRGLGAGLLPDAPVDEVMTSGPITAQGSDDLLDAFAVLRRAGVRRLPVLEDSELAGIITVDDLLVWLVGELAAVATPAAAHVIANGR